MHAKPTNDLHIIVTVVKRRFDPFLGLKVIMNENKIMPVSYNFTDDTYKIINDTEYSKIRFLRRFFYYHKVFSQLSSGLNEIIEQHTAKVSHIDKIYFYFSDESLWAEYLKMFCKKLKYKSELVNLQHGSFLMNKVSFIPMRILVNKISEKILRFPLLGFDFGGSEVDNYFVYSDVEKNYLQERSKKSKVIISPLLCKYHLIKDYLKFNTETQSNTNKTILFGMQPPEISEGCIYSEEAMYTHLKPLFQYLKQKGYTIHFRLHPGTLNPQDSIANLQKTGVFDLVEMANDGKIEYFMSISSIVISFHSTVIFDAFTLGKLPIVIKGFMKPFTFPIKHEVVNIFDNWEKELAEALAKQEQYNKAVQLSFEEETINFFSSKNKLEDTK